MAGLLGVLGGMTGEGQALILLGLAMGVGGAVHGGREGAILAAAGVALVVFVLVEGYLFSLRLAAASKARASRVFPPHPGSGRLEVRVVLENTQPISLGIVRVRDEPPVEVGVEGGAVEAAGYVPPYGRAELVYTVRAPVGSHEWGQLVVELVDPLGLYASRLAFQAEQRVLRVYPRPPRRALVQAVSLAALGGGGSRRRGFGVEFLELREYQPGDDFRLVEWRATARTGRLVVKVFEAETMQAVTVVLDATTTLYHAPCSPPPLEDAAGLTVDLAAAVSAAGGSYSLAVVEWDERLVRLGPLHGRAAVQAVSRVLAGLRWPPTRQSGGCGAGRAARVVGLAGRAAARPGIVVLVSDFCLDRRALGAYAEALRRLPEHARRRIVAYIPSASRCQLARLLAGAAAETLHPLGVRVALSGEELLRVVARGGAG